MQIAPLLMFTGQANEAMALYVATFPRSEIRQVTLYEADEPERAGTIKHATFTLAGRDFAVAYARKTVKDHRTLARAVRAGHLEALIEEE